MNKHNYISVDEFRDGMALLPAAVNVVTTGGPAGRAGVTASAICSVTDSPPTLLVCLNAGSRTLEMICKNGCLCVNTLSSEDSAISTAFSSRDLDADKRFQFGEWRTLVTSAPALKSSTVSFDTLVEDTKQVGSHIVLFCRVVSVMTPLMNDPLLYFRRSYQRLECIAS